MTTSTFRLLAAIGTLGALAVSSASAATLNVFSTADTYLRGGSADQNFGATTSILFGNHATVGPFTGLLRFDLSNPLLTGATINSVTLTLTSTGNGAGTSVTLDVFQLAAANADWVEGVQNGTNAVGSSSWNNKISSPGVIGATTTPWAGTVGARTAGTDYVNTSLASFTGNASTFGTGSLGFTSTGTNFNSAVASSAGGSLNLWVGTPSGAAVSDFFRIASRETADTASDPLLTIDYTIPEPSTYVLAGGALLGLVAFRRRRLS